VSVSFGKGVTAEAARSFCGHGGHRIVSRRAGSPSVAAELVRGHCATIRTSSTSPRCRAGRAAPFVQTCLFCGSRASTLAKRTHGKSSSGTRAYGLSVPLCTGTGYFFMSSNGLASGNSWHEAVLHGLWRSDRAGCYDAVVRRWTRRGVRPRDWSSTLSTIPIGTDILERFAAARLLVAVWETTSDVGVASFLCTTSTKTQASSEASVPSLAVGVTRRGMSR